MDRDPSIRVAIVEDDQPTRESLRALAHGSPEFNCVGAYATAEAALSHSRFDKPQVVLVGLELPELGGIDLVRLLRARDCGCQSLVLSIHDDEDYLFPALAAGASGYLLKSTPPARILEASVQWPVVSGPSAGPQRNMELPV
jgi:DNA-binding NarL/FixJ family response regulator